MKRVIPVFLVILIGVAICVPCFADGGSLALSLSNTALSNFNADYNSDFVDIRLIYRSTSHNNFFSYSNNVFTDGDHDPNVPDTFTIRFVNDDNYSYLVTLSSLSYFDTVFSNQRFVVPSGGYFDVTLTVDGDITTNGICGISSVERVDYSYSFWDSSSIILNIKNMFSFVSGSSIFSLFLVGVVISLGLVACRFIRKVMWSR